MMAKANAANERIKFEYFAFLKEAKGRDEVTIDRVAMSIARFEDSTGRRDFKRFHREQAVAFKHRLGQAINARSGERLSKATVQAMLRDLKAFFEWLSREPGYRRKVAFSDADYFNLSDKDAAIAQARREKVFPTIQQVEHVLALMPVNTPVERRDRALIAFASLTGARVNALASFQLGHVVMEGGFVDQDARQVRTKYAKTFRTYLMPVCEGALAVVEAWISELREARLWGAADPLFPSTEMGLSEAGGFQVAGLARCGWTTTEPIREVFRRAFAIAGLPYFNPHSFRDMLVHHAMSLDLSPEQMKAWSQNLGHEGVLTTFTSYGKLSAHRQGELIQSTSKRRDADEMDNEALLAAIAAKLSRAA
jgi:integrase